jgi:hypothetical protein
VQEAASHADPRTTMRYDRARTSVDRHATYVVARLGGRSRPVAGPARPCLASAAAKWPELAGHRPLSQRPVVIASPGSSRRCTMVPSPAVARSTVRGAWRRMRRMRFMTVPFGLDEFTVTV